MGKYKKNKKEGFLRKKSDLYLKRDKNFFVVERVKEAIGSTINRIAKNNVKKKDKLI